MKTCIVCGEEKPLEDFPPQRRKCNVCHVAYIRDWQKKNTDKVRQHTRKYRVNNPEVHRRTAIAQYHTKRANGWSPLTVATIERVFATYPKVCMKCRSNQNVEIDHIIPISKGGTNDFDNLQLLCVSCNRSKGNREQVDYRANVA